MSFVILAASLYIGVFAAEAIKYTGVVNISSGTLNVREKPDAGSADIGDFYKNDTVSIYSEKTKGTDGRYWYKVSYNGGFGYVCADYIKNVVAYIPPAQYEPDATFEENLTKQGFPESYKVLLRQLHAAHPSWIFIADHIPLTWAEVLDAESKIGKSLVSNSRPDSYKSMEYGAYNWDTGSFVGFDGSGWVAAHRDTVAYYLEPRNFLNEQGIFQFLDQSYNENLQNIDGLKAIIEGSFLANEYKEDGYNSYAELIMAAGKASRVSPYVLAAMIIQEQGRGGTGGLIQGNNSELPGYYNHFSIGAYPSGELDAVQRGLRYARGDYASAASKEKYGLPWNTKAKSIIGGAIWYGSGYIDVGQDTLYYKKFDLIGPSYYTHQYMTNIEAAYSESLIMKEAYAEVPANTALVFSVPVFKDMPEQNSTALVSGGKNNYFLKALSIDGQSITPSFEMYKTGYETVVDYNISKINIKATPVDGAKVSGAGVRELRVGENIIKINVTAASGKTADYVISVTRKEGEGAVVTPTPEITTDFTLGTYLTGIQPETSVDSFKKGFTVKNGVLKILNSSNKEKTSGNIVTGDKIIVYDNDTKEFLNKTAVIYGDTNGDGRITIVDLANIQKHLLGVKTQGGIFAISSDTNKDGKISIVDLANIQKHLLNVKKITQ